MITATIYLAVGSSRQHKPFTSFKLHLNDDAFLQQTLFLRAHNKIMRLVLVINYIFQINTRRVFHIFEELLIKNVGNAAGNVADLILKKQHDFSKVSL